MKTFALTATVTAALLGPQFASAAHAAPAPPTYQRLQSVPLPGDGGWDYMTLDAAARRLYVTHSTHVLVLNCDTLKVIGDIRGTDGVHGVALAPKLGRGYTSDGKSNSVTVFNLKTLKPLAQIGVGERPDSIVYEPVTQRVFTLNGGGDSATAIDAKTNKVLGTIALGGRPEAAVADGRGMIYDNIEDKNEIVAIDAKTLTIKARYPLAPLESPSGLAMDTKHRRLFAVCDGGKMAVVTAATGKVIATPAIGNGPDAAAYDPGTGLVFSSNGEDGTLTVVAGGRVDYMLRGAPVTVESYSPLQTIATQAGARTLALDPKTHRVFLVTATAAPAAPGTPPWRRSYLPGTFTLLVYGPQKAK